MSLFGIDDVVREANEKILNLECFLIQNTKNRVLIAVDLFDYIISHVIGHVQCRFGMTLMD